MNSPFNEQRYKELLEGLEISEVKFSYVKQSCEVFRLDSFYYSKEFLNDEYQIDNVKRKRLRDLSSSILSFGAYSLNNFVEYKNCGIPFIRGVNLKNGILDFNDVIFIDKEAHKLLWKSEVFPKTILLSMSGTIGDVAIAMPDYFYPMNSNQDIAKIRINDNVNTYYVYVFLLSRYGQNYLKREARGSVQQHVFLSQMENFDIPIPSISFQKQVERVVLSSHSDLSKSNSLYSELQNLIMDELGLNNWQPSDNLVNVKSLKESFLSGGRLDAEHYQMKYDELFNLLKQYDTKMLGELVSISKSVEPGSDYYLTEGVPFVRVSDLTKFGVTKPSIYLDKKIFKDVIRPKKDTILMSKDGSIGIAYKVEKDEDFITSGAILHLKIIDNNILPDYLTLVINSKVVQMQAERDAGGSIIQHWKPSEISNVVIPVLPMEKQQEISQKVQESFRLRNESKRLLNVAKTAVEIAIGESEEKAIHYIEENKTL